MVKYKYNISSMLERTGRFLGRENTFISGSVLLVLLFFSFMLGVILVSHHRQNDVGLDSKILSSPALAYSGDGSKDENGYGSGSNNEEGYQGGMPWRSYEEAATSITTALIYGWFNLVCNWHGKHLYPPKIDEWHYDASQCSPPPYIPLSEYKELGIRSFFIRGDTYFPINMTLCQDLLQYSFEEADNVNPRERMVECLKRHGVSEKDIPPEKIPPNVLPPPPKDQPYKMFSLRDGDRNFEVDPRIFTKGKVGHPATEPFWSRALGIRITAGGLNALEIAVEGYLNQNVSCQLVNGSFATMSNLNCEANKSCKWTDTNNRCRDCCDSDGSCHPSSGGTNNWCTTNQCPPGAGSSPSPCPAGVPCPTFAGCDTSSYQCTDIPLFGDCATFDQYQCDSRVSGCGSYVAGDWRCIYLSTNWGGAINLELADCPNRSSFTCTPFTSSTGDDGLIVDAQVGDTYLEAFLRVGNHLPFISGCSGNRCNTTQTEITCSSDCGESQWCGCRCCSGAQRGCDIIAWPPGCPCCDDYIRLRFQLTGSPAVTAYNLAFLLYGPVSVPFMTACGVSATSFKGSHPGEWLDLCACNQDVSINAYDSSFCDWGICGALVDLIENFQAGRVRCMVHDMLNKLIGGALRSALSSSLPISLMETMGACNLTGWDIGAYPELAAGGSFGYSYNYSTGGAGIILFSDATARLTAMASCVMAEGGSCPQYPAAVPSTSCKTNPQNCFPDITGYNVGIYVDQEFINELLYIFWTRGFLCYEFSIPWDTAKIIIPGLRQINPNPPAGSAVLVSLVPVCGPAYTTQFSTGAGSSFTVNIPRFRVRFRTNPTAGSIQLFDLVMNMTLSGNLGIVYGSCHPADTLCPTNPTYRCQACAGSTCTWQNIQYGPGYFNLSNITIDPNVVAIDNTHPSIGTPANTDIADLLVVLLNGAINNGVIQTRMYDLLRLLPIAIPQINFFGFAQNALLLRYNFNPICINFILDFGNFTPPISEMLEKGVLIPGPKIDGEVLSPSPSPETSKNEPEIDTMVSLLGANAPRIKFYSSSPTFIHLRMLSPEGRLKFKVMHELKGFFPDGITQKVKYFWWFPKTGGLFWHKIEGDTFDFRPIREEEEIEVFAVVEEMSEERGGPFYHIVDKTPVRIKIETGLEGEIVGPSKIKAGEVARYIVKSDFPVDRVAYSLDGINWSDYIKGDSFSFTPEESGKFKLQVVFQSGEYSGRVEKEVEVEGGINEIVKGCGKFGIAGFFTLVSVLISYVLLVFAGIRRKKNGNGVAKR